MRVRRQRTFLLYGVGLLLALWVLRANYCLSLVSGTSMAPGLQTGDLLLVSRRAYQDTVPKRGDIVVARSPTGLIVKRVVGLPGESIEVREGRLHINDLPFAEKYDIEAGILNIAKGRLFEDKYAVLGDNRSVPLSLSVHAILTRDQIVGKVVHSFRFRPDHGLIERVVVAPRNLPAGYMPHENM